MKIRLNEYKGRAADSGKRTSNEEIATATGIGISTVESISAGRVKEIRLEYLDALSTYFALLLGVDMSEIDLTEPEPVEIPLDLNIRPDRHGRRVGQPSPQRPRRTNGHAARRPTSDARQTALASEAVLVRDWDTPEEDEAWADL